MRILFVNTLFRLFDGIDCGAANRSTMFVRALTQLGHVDVVSFYKEPIKSNIDNCEVIYSRYIDSDEKKRNKWSRILDKIRRHVDVKNPKSYYDINPRCEAVVDEIYAKGKYDIVACRYLGTAIICGLEKYASRLVIEVDDNPSAAAKRQLAITNYPNPWSRYTTLYRANAIGWMAKAFLCKVLCSFYSNKMEPPCKKSVYLPNVTTIHSAFSPVMDDTPLRLLIVGWLDYWPNKLGTSHFAAQVFPKIRERLPQAELHIVGKSSDENLTKELNAIEGVSALGFVDDIEEEYQNARICIVPIYQGAGTSVKFVEGLSMGRTVISTPMGARGFDDICQDGRDYLLANTDNDFVELISKTLCDSNRLNEIAKSAYQVAKANFSQESFSRIVVDTIKKIACLENHE